MEKKNADHLNRLKQKLDFLDVSVKALLDMDIDRRLSDMERQLKSIAPEVQLMQTNRMLRADYRAMATSASSRRKKDRTVYLFEDEQIRKKDIVLKCLKRYMAENSITQAKQIRERFPSALRRTYGVIQSIETVKDRGWEQHFHMDDILHLTDGDYVVCSAWDITNISSILDVFINELHYDIVPFEDGRRKDRIS